MVLLVGVLLFCRGCNWCILAYTNKAECTWNHAKNTLKLREICETVQTMTFLRSVRGGGNEEDLRIFIGSQFPATSISGMDTQMWNKNTLQQARTMSLEILVLCKEYDNNSGFVITNTLIQNKSKKVKWRFFFLNLSISVQVFIKETWKMITIAKLDPVPV